jgi:hypothetical protein
MAAKKKSNKKRPKTASKRMFLTGPVTYMTYEEFVEFAKANGEHNVQIFKRRGKHPFVMRMADKGGTADIEMTTIKKLLADHVIAPHPFHHAAGRERWVVREEDAWRHYLVGIPD